MSTPARGYWFVVCGLWFVVCGLWFVVCGLWFVVCGLWFVVCVLRFAFATVHQICARARTRMQAGRPRQHQTRLLGSQHIGGTRDNRKPLVSLLSNIKGKTGFNQSAALHHSPVRPPIQENITAARFRSGIHNLSVTCHTHASHVTQPHTRPHLYRPQILFIRRRRRLENFQHGGCSRTCKTKEEFGFKLSAAAPAEASASSGLIATPAPALFNAENRWQC